MSSKKRPTYPLRALEKSLRILEALAKEESYMSIAQLSDKLKMYPSTIHRSLDTLRYLGYVEQDPDSQKYQLALKVLELGMAKLRQIDLVKEAAPYLKEVVARCGETVHLAALDDGEVLYLAKEEPTQTVRLISYVGKRHPAFCTALGKILLAHLPEEEQEKIMKEKGLYRFTETTIVNEGKLKQELHKVKEQGFAQDRGEHEEDVNCIAAPIRNHQGEVIAAISISGPAFRLDNKKQNQLKEALVQLAEKISRRVGYANEFPK